MYPFGKQVFREAYTTNWGGAETVVDLSEDGLSGVRAVPVTGFRRLGNDLSTSRNMRRHGRPAKRRPDHVDRITQVIQGFPIDALTPFPRGTLVAKARATLAFVSLGAPVRNPLRFPVHLGQTRERTPQ